MSTHASTNLLYCLSVTVSLLLIGCSATDSRPVYESPALLADGLPALSELRGSSELVALELDGSDFSQQANGTIIATDLELQSLIAGTAFGIWTFTPGADSLSSVELNVLVPEGNEYFAAVADYASWRWAVEGPFDLDTMIELDDATHLSPLGNCFIAVIVAPGKAALVDKLTLNVDSRVWHITPVDTIPDAGRYTSMLVVNGKPAIAYNNYTDNVLYYVRALDANGENWGTPLLLDSDNRVGLYNSMKIIDGFPAISYINDELEILKYVRALDDTGTNWGTPIVVDATSGVGFYSSLATVNENPAISYYDETNDLIKLIRANNSTGTDWGAPLTIAAGSIPSNMAIINGNPAISYSSVTGTQMMYIRASNVNGTIWGTEKEIDTSGAFGVALNSCLATVDGNPAIAYYSSNEKSLKYLRATDADGTNWNLPGYVDIQGEPGLDISMQIVNGMPAISYYNNTSDELLFIQATDSTGANWGNREVVDTNGNVGSDLSMAIVNGSPAIAYNDIGNADLVYARLY